MADATYDVIVIGGGSTGENVASRATEHGLSAIVIENELLGGDCSYWACMPSKALLRSPEALRSARGVGGAKEAAGGSLSVADVFARRNGFVSNWDDTGQVKWLESASVPLMRGRARLAGARRVDVTGGDGATRTLEARQAIAVCTGSVPALPPIEGLDEVDPWTTKDATSAVETPDSLVIVGGGVAACEMADAYRSLGSDVIIIERGPRLLGGYEPAAGEHLAMVFGERGIDVRTGVTASHVERGDDAEDAARVIVTLDEGNTVTAEELLVATGRSPRTDGLGLETVELPPREWLDVDDTCRVGGVKGGWLYAVGDVNRRSLLTHMGKYQARACADAIAARARDERVDGEPWRPHAATADRVAVPQVVFTDPQVAAVGYTEEAAREAGMRVNGVEYDLGGVAGSVLHADGYRGYAKMVVDESRHVVVGATLVGPAAGDLLHAATVAIVGEVPLERLWHAVPCFPTMSEIWLRLLETYGL